MTMIKVPAGSFYRRHGGTSRSPAKPDFLDAPLQEVILTRPFLMSDSEVTLGQYLQMKDDVDFPESEKPFDGRWGSLALRPNQVGDPM